MAKVEAKVDGVVAHKANDVTVQDFSEGALHIAADLSNTENIALSSTGRTALLVSKRLTGICITGDDVPEEIRGKPLVVQVNVYGDPDLATTE